MELIDVPLMKNQKKSQSLFKNILQQSNGNVLEMWLHQIPQKCGSDFKEELHFCARFFISGGFIF